jgi:hypothetical protein
MVLVSEGPGKQFGTITLGPRSLTWRQSLSNGPWMAKRSSPLYVFVRFPVVCPLCGTETLAQRLLEQLVADLADDRCIELNSDCHEISWPASECERDRIRDYCAVARGVGSL